MTCPLLIAWQARVAMLVHEDQEERKSLPAFIKRLTKGYTMSSFWFEIFECIRKLAIACAAARQTRLKNSRLRRRAPAAGVALTPASLPPKGHQRPNSRPRAVPAAALSRRPTADSLHTFRLGLPPGRCLPVFFQPSGSVSQLLFGLIVCFVSFGAYVAIDPFEDVGNDTLAKMCQAQIFFSLLSSVALSYDEETRQNATNLDILLVALWFIPMTLAILLQTPVIGAVQMILKKKKARDEKTIVKKHHRVAPEPGPKAE